MLRPCGRLLRASGAATSRKFSDVRSCWASTPLLLLLLLVLLLACQAADADPATAAAENAAVGPCACIAPPSTAPPLPAPLLLAGSTCGTEENATSVAMRSLRLPPENTFLALMSNARPSRTLGGSEQKTEGLLLMLSEWWEWDCSCCCCCWSLEGVEGGGGKEKGPAAPVLDALASPLAAA